MDPKLVVPILRRSELFGALPEADLVAIAHLAEAVRHPSGSAVVRQGDPADALYIVTVGSLRVRMLSPEGKETTLDTMVSGQLFGELALIDGQPRVASVVTLEDCRLLRVARPPFLELLRRRPELSLALMQSLVTLIRRYARQVEEGATLDARAKLVRHLRRLSEQHGRETESGLLIDVALSQSALASSLGLSRQTVNRILQELVAEGIVEVQRSRILIRDSSRLVAAERSSLG